MSVGEKMGTSRCHLRPRCLMAYWHKFIYWVKKNVKCKIEKSAKDENGFPNLNLNLLKVHNYLDSDRISSNK